MLGISCPKVFRGFKGGFFQKPPLARRLRRGFQSQLGAYSGCSASATQKFLRDLKGAFFKKPPFPFGVSFDSFSLRLRPQRKTAKESDKTKERVTLRQGGRGDPSPTNIRITPKSGDQWSPLQWVVSLMFAPNSVEGHSICPRPDTKLLFLLFYQIP